MKKKVIFHAGSLTMGGIGIVLLDIINNINKEKYEVILFLTEDHGAGNVLEKEVSEEVKIFYLKSYKILEKTEMLKNKNKNLKYYLLYKLYKILEKINMKLIFFKFIRKNSDIKLFIDFNCGFTNEIKKYKGIKKIGWVHNSINEWAKTEKKIEKIGKELCVYDKVISICNDMREELNFLYPSLRGKIKTIYNPLDFSRIIEMSLDDELLDMKEKELMKENYILAISRLENNQKDYNTLLEAYGSALKNGIKEKLYIIGEGSSRKEIEEKIKNLKLEKNVILLGMKKNPYIWLKNSTFFTHSSNYEGFGLVLVEAMICGKAVVSTNCPVGPREVLDDGKYGKLVPLKNEQSYAKALLEMSKEYKKYEQKVTNGIGKFEKKVIIKQIEELIDNLYL